MVLLLQTKNKDTKEVFLPINDHYFIIYYHANKEQYYFKVPHHSFEQLSSLVFIKINKNYPVDNNLILLCSNKIFQLILSDTNTNELTIKLLSNKKGLSVQ